jgi:hypothetical protein
VHGIFEGGWRLGASQRLRTPICLSFEEMPHERVIEPNDFRQRCRGNDALFGENGDSIRPCDQRVDIVRDHDHCQFEYSL